MFESLYVFNNNFFDIQHTNTPHNNMPQVRDKRANIQISTKNGSSALILACGNEDCDPKVVRYLLDCGVNVHRKIVSSTIQWKILRAASRLAVRLKITRSRLTRRVAESGGLTALHYASRRGDMEIVELLLEYGAKPSIENDLGRDVLS